MSHGVTQFLSLILSLAICSTILAGDDSPAVDVYGDPLPEGALARLGTVRYRGFSGSGRLEFLSDGHSLLGSTRDQLVWLDVRTGRVVRRFDLEIEHTGLLAVTDDFSQAAVKTRQLVNGPGESTNGVAIVDTETGRVRTRLPLRGETARFGIRTACFTPDGQRLVTGEYEGVLRIWSTTTGREEHAQALPDSRELLRVVVSSNGEWIAACSYSGAFLWNWNSENEPKSFSVPGERIYTVEFSPDGRTVATGSDSHVGMRLFDVESGQQIRRLTADKRYYYPYQLSFSSDGSRLAAPSQNNLQGRHAEAPGEVDIWNVETGELLRAFPFHEGLRCVAISPDDRWLAATVYEGTIAAWDLESGQSVSDEYFGHLGGSGTLVANPSGTLVATAGNEGMAVLWDIETGRTRHVLRHDSGKMVRGLAFSPDESLLATSAFDDSVVVWDTNTGERVYTLFGHGELGGQRAVRFSADCEQLLSFGDDWFLRVFDVRTGKALIEHAIRPSGLSLKNNVDGSANTEYDRLMFHSIPSGHFSPDGEIFVLAIGTDVYRYDVETGAETRRHTFGVTQERCTISHDFRRIAFLSQDPETSIAICDLSTGELQRTIPVADNSVSQITFSPDGSKLAMTAEFIRVYDTGSGRELARIEPDVRPGYGLAFTPDGERLVTSHYDTTALVWDWRRFQIGGVTE